jgi:hypothetical protein
MENQNTRSLKSVVCQSISLVKTISHSVDIVDIGRISNTSKNQVANASYFLSAARHHISPSKIEIAMA